MEIVSFFSAKGGTGKTTFNLLFASYLSYICKKRVLMLDFDGPEYNALLTRKRELAVNKDVDEKELYPLEMVNDRSINSVNALAKRLDALKEHIDYVIMDFGGSFEPSDAVCQMAKAKVLNTVIISVEMDGMAISSAKSLAKVFQSFGQRTILFFNKVHGKEKPELYEALDEWFAKNNLNISKNRVKMAISLKRDSDSDGMFLRRSICFPQKDIKAINPVRMIKAPPPEQEKPSSVSEHYVDMDEALEIGPFRCMFIRDEKIKNGQRVAERLLEEYKQDGIRIPANTHLQAICKIDDRLRLTIRSLEMNGKIIPLQLEAYDSDGLVGIYCPEASKAAKTATNDLITTAGSSLGGLVGNLANTVIRTGATIARTASGENTVSINSGYEFYLVKIEKR